MAEIVGSLFGITPDMYERQQQALAEDRAIRMANLEVVALVDYWAVKTLN